MDYKVFNTTDSQVLKLEKGDQIYGKIEKKSGKLSVMIRKEERILFLKAKICLQVPSGWRLRKEESTGSQ